jgi:F0F1-type ATP synthase assembly protein I
LSIPSKILICQLGIGGALAVLLTTLNSPEAGFAAILATGVVAVPNAIFVWRQWQVLKSGPADPAKLARLAVLQIVMRLGLSLLLLAVCIIRFQPEFGPFIGTFIALQAVVALAPWLDRQQPATGSRES